MQGLAGAYGEDLAEGQSTKFRCLTISYKAEIVTARVVEMNPVCTAIAGSMIIDVHLRELRGTVRKSVITSGATAEEPSAL